jgi:eukaryotic-like serine/threonine-protein kinase
MTERPSELASTELSDDVEPRHDSFLREVAHVPSHGRPVMDVATGSVIAGKFRVERCLGSGGMGAVYAVRHELTRHRRALKLLHAERCAKPEIVARFLAEASAAGRVGSPHLVETYDAGTLPSGEPYLVMELLEGETFGELIERTGTLAPELACELVAQAAEGVDAAHRAGIIHRDLKPDNLFIVRRPEGMFVKILDFGISKFNTHSIADRHSTLAGAVFGTPAYMAPEQLASAKDVDERADVFALGAVLFECLGGQSPYQAPSVHAIIARVTMGKPTPLASLRSGLSPALIALVERATRADPRDRTRSARALIDELAIFRGAGKLELSETQTSVAAAPSLPPRRRARGMALAVLLVAVVVSWFVARERPVTSEPVTLPVVLPVVATHDEPAALPQGLQTPEVLAPASPPSSRAPVSAPRKSKAAVSEPAPVSRKSRVKELGLREENPFR